MPSPRNSSLSGELTIETVLGALEKHKERLCKIIESEDTTPENKFDALVLLASMTGILTSAANGRSLKSFNNLSHKEKHHEHIDRAEVRL